ncbi:HEPN domain-containing protein [Ilyomonas limi]|uniref:HEPN domain-containing protein n=2 Tax=Ilyomonas limi TaxID=2575867 RepID=A0A4U3L537_9BACT|nr:HEPN domain-containing protein [Ilyomonas limi]
MGAVSRMYYVCFHTTLALLLTKDITPKTHKGALTELHKDFVLEGGFDKAKADSYKTLMQESQESDYGDFMAMTREEADQLLLSAKEYINYITSLLTSP